MEKYIPRPLDTRDIELSDELISLAERLAKNVHEVWAQGKIDEGWTYGETVDEENKKHPSLVPYRDLSEEQKDYDRRTSQETLKFVIASGFKISKG